MAETGPEQLNGNMPDLSLYGEDDLLPLSALQHLLFCDRQCALIHIEQIWVENLFTAEGRIMHERVDSGRRRPGEMYDCRSACPCVHCGWGCQVKPTWWSFIGSTVKMEKTVRCGDLAAFSGGA